MFRVVSVFFLLLFFSACSRVTTPYYSVNIPFVDLEIDAKLDKENGMIHAAKVEKYFLLKYCHTKLQEGCSIKAMNDSLKLKKVACNGCEAYDIISFDKGLEMNIINMRGYVIQKDDVITYMVYISEDPNETQEAIEGLFEDVVKGGF